MTQHTPGPWEACMPRGGPTLSVDTAANQHIAAVDASDRDMTEACANARLIAAAPDLLRALEWFVDFAGKPCEPGENGANLCQHRDCETVRTALAAISKAKG